MKYSIFLLLVAFLQSGCSQRLNSSGNCDIQKSYSENANRVKTGSGVWGTVAFQEGNCMPTVGTSNTCKTCPVKRTIRIYEYTAPANVNRGTDSGFFSSINSKLVREVKSDKKGFYQAELPDGQYSVVIEENGKLYANGTDEKGGINPVTVKGGMEKLDIIINYKAVY